MKPIEQIERELKEAIIKEVPEIVELKFGCRVRINNTWDGDTVVTITGMDDEYVYYAYKDGGQGDEDSLEFYSKMIVEVLGRPINLSDVLQAMDINSTDDTDVKLSISSNLLRLQNTEDACLWNLSQPLDEQSEETLRFLHSVICKK